MYPLRLFGDPVLKQRAREVEELTDDLVTLVNGMYDTMDFEDGIGLAAPQVGVRKRLFTFDLHEGEGPGVVFNPEIVESDGEVGNEKQVVLSYALWQSLFGGDAAAVQPRRRRAHDAVEQRAQYADHVRVDLDPALQVLRLSQ